LTELVRLERHSLSDNLTGLQNHRKFQEDIKVALEEAGQSGRPLSLAIVDIDDFKTLNDVNGHLHGDRVLVRAAEQLRLNVPEGAAYRVGSDEFAVIYADTPIAAAADCIERFRESLRAKVGVTVTAGISTTAATDDPDAIIEQADAALFEGKRGGRDSVVAFDAARDSESMLSPAKARALRAVIEAPQLDIHFQPIWEIGGTVLGYEALARPDMRYGFRSTQEMFDTAERLRRMPEVDARCREAILSATSRLPPDGLIFMNVSPQTLESDRNFRPRLIEAVQACGIAPNRIVIELTERSLARVNVVVLEVKRLGDAGFRIALDDTGAGNAGLQLLSAMPIDFIKIDHEVVINALRDTTSRGVLAGIVAIAHETGAYIIAEGIESHEILMFLRDFAPRVRALQGFYLGMPAADPIDETARLRAARLVLQSSAPAPSFGRPG
jgi:diguanylate cyclase (GGDEF)-like protein